MYATQFAYICVAVIIQGQPLLKVGSPEFLVLALFDFGVFMMWFLSIIHVGAQANLVDTHIRILLKQMARDLKDLRIYCKKNMVFMDRDKSLPTEDRVHVMTLIDESFDSLPLNKYDGDKVRYSMTHQMLFSDSAKFKSINEVLSLNLESLELAVANSLETIEFKTNNEQVRILGTPLSTEMLVSIVSSILGLGQMLFTS